MMGLDMWFRDDIGNIISGLALATPRMGSDHPDGGAAFQEGYTAALVAVAVSFGIRDLSGLQLPQPPETRPRLRDVTPTLPRLPGRGNY